MNVLLLGGQGMAGHMIASYWHRNTNDRLIATVRPGTAAAAEGGSIQGNRLPDEDDRFRLIELDVRDFLSVEQAVVENQPAIIVNAVGVLNRKAEERPLEAHLLNGLLPHWLAFLADRYGARLLHISSDCVFSGLRGRYREDEQPDGSSVYARTKALGEVRDTRHLTIRTSIIGPDGKPDGIGLMRWFLTREGEVTGYRNVPWNGVTTLELAKAAVWLSERPAVGGLIHLAASEPITKHDLLRLMQKVFKKSDVSIVPEDQPHLDRTLAVTCGDERYVVPDYERMLRDLQLWMCET